MNWLISSCGFLCDGFDLCKRIHAVSTVLNSQHHMESGHLHTQWPVFDAFVICALAQRHHEIFYWYVEKCVSSDTKWHMKLGRHCFGYLIAWSHSTNKCWIPIYSAPLCASENNSVWIISRNWSRQSGCKLVETVPTLPIRVWEYPLHYNTGWIIFAHGIDVIAGIHVLAKNWSTECNIVLIYFPDII